MSVLGDGIAQAVTAARKGEAVAVDGVRAARMGGFGLVLYGPLQHYWYAFLDRSFPVRTSIPHFLNKLVWNQVILGPTVLVSVFTWTHMLTPRFGTVGERWDMARDKIKSDLVSTMLKGWTFWVPAAAINFAVIPLPSQVLYMSACGVFWNFFLSMASNAPPQPAAKAKAAAKDGKK